jgi:ADP-ribose pyrophosphatase YjhB (NUDIX family)
MSGLVHTDTSLGRTIVGTWFEAPFRPWLPRAYGVCFTAEGDIVLVRNQGEDTWWIPGGGVEVRETIEEGLIREILEETTGHVVAHRYLGCHRVDDFDHPNEPHTDFHVYFWCRVELEEFVPTDIVERRLIRPEEFMNVIAWPDDPATQVLLELALAAEAAHVSGSVPPEGANPLTHGGLGH